MLRTSFALGLWLAASVADAQTTHSGTFDVHLAGLRAGVLGFSGVEDGGRYTARSLLRNSGLLALVREVSYEGFSTGRVTAEGYVPARYEEVTNTGKRVSEASMDYVNGVPQLKVYKPPQDRGKDALDPSTQRGTLDPMTAIYALLKDVPGSEVCTLNVFMFDGKRRSQVAMSDPMPDNGKVVCRGIYRRIAGFSRRELEERSDFPFTLSYSPAGNETFRVSRIVFDTLYGKATLIRR